MNVELREFGSGVTSRERAQCHNGSTDRERALETLVVRLERELSAAQAQVQELRWMNAQLMGSGSGSQHQQMPHYPPSKRHRTTVTTTMIGGDRSPHIVFSSPVSAVSLVDHLWQASSDVCLQTAC